MKTERDWIDRVDDAILAQSHQLSRLREQSIHASIADFRQTSIENRDLSIDDDGHHIGDYDIWALRIERCDLMLANPDVASLRRRAAQAASAA